METQKVLELAVGLLLGAYAYIFHTQNKRIENLECLDCNPEACQKRFAKIEDKQDKLDPVLTEIKVQLARIEVTLQELKSK